MPQTPLIEALANLSTISTDIDSGKPLSSLETLFQISHSHADGLNPFVRELINSPFWRSQDYPNNPFPSLCQALSLEIDQMNGSMEPNEPPYHSRRHFQDVCLALTLLLQQSIRPSECIQKSHWMMRPEDAWLLFFCAIGHDYGHDGSINHSPHELENESIKNIRRVLHKSNLSTELLEQIMTKVEPIILSTDPTVFSSLIQKFTGETPAFNKNDCLSMLMVEADLMGSTLPMHGLQLSQLLAQEWEISNPKSSLTVASAVGRLGFLKHIRFISPHAIKLGIDKIRQESINQLKR